MKTSYTLALASVASAAVVTVTEVIATEYTTVTISLQPSDYTETISTVSPTTSSVGSPISLSSSSSDTTASTTGTTSSSSTTVAAETTTPTTSDTTTSSSTSSTSTSTTTLTEIENEFLTTHNEKRALHGVDPLVWDVTLAEYAYNYAASTVDCDNIALTHSGGPYGENLAAGYSGGVAPVEAWYNEISSYDYSNPGYSTSTGHFTQVVWKSTTNLGCAIITCDNIWKQYSICSYSPAGNVEGEYEENVLALV